jgi:hypothetical protein
MRVAHGEVTPMLIAQLFTPLLSAAATDADFAGKSVLFIVAIIVPVLGLVCTIIAIVLSNKRNPPIAEEMHKAFVPRPEWDASVQRLHGRIDEANGKITASEAHTGSKIDSMRNDMNKVFHDVERALGRVEGKLEEKQ